jgi:hypothetical protein
MRKDSSSTSHCFHSQILLWEGLPPLLLQCQKNRQIAVERANERIASGITVLPDGMRGVLALSRVRAADTRVGWLTDCY